MIGIIFAAILPQFALIRDSWDVKQGTAEALQNGRVLTDHINRNLLKAVRITAVSESSVTNGYIEYEDNDGNTFKYEYVASENNDYVRFGPLGNLSDLAGPVSSLKFTCYDACDLDTPLSPVTDANVIRTVKVDATITNSASMGQNKTFTTWVYLRTNANNGGLVGGWKLDETSGRTAADSSGSGNNGTFYGDDPCWVAGILGGAVDFNGVPDYFEVNSLNNSNKKGDAVFTVTGWFKTSQSTGMQTIVGNWSQTGSSAYQGWEVLVENNKVVARIGSDGDYGDVIGTTVVTDGQWHHFAFVYYPAPLSSFLNNILYVDGNEQGTRIYMTIYAEEPTEFRIGDGSYVTTGGTPNKGGPFNGIIDDVCIYNRALSAAEIADMANILSYKGFAEAKAGPYSPVVTIPKPVGTNAGDLLIAVVATDGATSGVMKPTVSSNWQLIDRGNYNNTVSLGAWWKIATASEPATYQFDWFYISEDAYGWIMRFTGHDPVNPINASAVITQAASSNPTSPEVTSTVNGCLILRLGGFDYDDIVVDSPGLPNHIPITMDESHDTDNLVAYGGFSDAKVSSDSTSITLSLPSGTSQGDLLIAAVATDGNTSSSILPPSGKGWTLDSRKSSSGEVTMGVWYKNASASESSTHQFTWSGGQQAYGWMMRFTASNPSIGPRAYATGTSSTPTCPTTVLSGPYPLPGIVLRLGAFDDDAITVGSPGLPDHNAITMDRSNTGADSVSGGAGYKIQASPGYTGTANFSLTPPDQEYVTATIGIWSAVYADTVSGGAGYVRQSAAGSSGTSNFSLTSPNGARMLTIAIAPASTNIHGCCGDPRP
jgi:hypothetical protein